MFHLKYFTMPLKYFKKAIVKKLHKEFPYDRPREAFDAVKDEGKDYLDVVAIGALMRKLDPGYTQEEIEEIVKDLDIRQSGKISFEDFKKIFIADIRTADAM